MKKVAALMLSGSVLFALGGVGAVNAGVDEADALKLIRESKCSRCHAVDKPKIGTPYQETAAKYRDNPNAVAEIIDQITNPSQVEVDGEMDDHGIAKTRSADRIKNLAEWILSR